MLKTVEPGDLVSAIDDGELGLVLEIHDGVEIPPLIEVFWMVSNTTNKMYQDELQKIEIN